MIRILLYTAVLFLLPLIPGLVLIILAELFIVALAQIAYNKNRQGLP